MFATTHHATNVHHHMADVKSSSAIRADRQMRHERMVGFGVTLLIGALFAGMMYLAIVFGGYASVENTGYNFWMMP